MATWRDPRFSPPAMANQPRTHPGMWSPPSQQAAQPPPMMRSPPRMGPTGYEPSTLPPFAGSPPVMAPPVGNVPPHAFSPPNMAPTYEPPPTGFLPPPQQAPSEQAQLAGSPGPGWIRLPNGDWVPPGHPLDPSYVQPPEMAGGGEQARRERERGTLGALMGGDRGREGRPPEMRREGERREAPPPDYGIEAWEPGEPGGPNIAANVQQQVANQAMPYGQMDTANIYNPSTNPSGTQLPPSTYMGWGSPQQAQWQMPQWQAPQFASSTTAQTPQQSGTLGALMGGRQAFQQRRGW